MSSRIYLLDANVLIAASVTEHLFHDRALDWLARRQPRIATCPTTQGALLRYLCLPQHGHSIESAKRVLKAIVSRPDHTFWPNDVSYTALPERGLRGHKQITDFYLVAIAGKNGGRLATSDAAIAALFPEVCELI